MLNLIIDRVGAVNVFNILDSTGSGSESHLQSTMDEDLILEYIKEIENLVRVSVAIHQKSPQRPTLDTDILHDLKILGETFFDQFFPAPIQEKLRLTTEKYLHFNIDPKLGVIPWELLHDGTCFLSDKFYIGKTVRGEAHGGAFKEKEKLRMLIIADPTEDLEWAQKEGEQLFRVLSEKVPTSRLEIEFIGGRQVTKLKLLSLIKGKNIIHYSGHLYFSDDPLENGWLISEGRILKAREIKNSGFNTDMVFSNSCQSNKSTNRSLNSDLMNNFAGSFLMSGIKSFIGTNWEIPDNQNTIDFTILFYTNLFADKSVGESLYLAKEQARRNYDPSDLTWTNYSLHGQPNIRVVSDPAKGKPVHKIINPSLIFKFYPNPIALSYYNFTERQKEESLNSFLLMEYLIRSFEEFSKVLGGILFSDHQNHALGKFIPNNPDDAYAIDKWWDLMFQCLHDFRKLEISPVISDLGEILFANKDIILKMIQWIDLYSKGQIQPESADGYLITFQYYFENLLTELEEMERISIFLVSTNSNSHLFFRGLKPESSLVAAPMIKQDFIGEQIEKFRGRVIVFHEDRMQIFPLNCNIVENPESKELELAFLGFRPSKPGNLPHGGL
ncbi:CHAT domain-containing protein [Leptospira wolffii]|uniref:CHAT domain-containing protein n=1 Tax=Leptospira wolffii TaxID=409998 RepID=UPI0003490FE5|nr:CHAT domain-containing protein [Leptospira wolffii]TGK61665.1 CHAT domain-containing protein [Leptospira wolffii]TGK70209.1 CHAT domain-containing protein [Leptospira wolffii]TGK77132.1 CHAT domain-containing protein [Leptospira wolffii]TGL31016.1 CHAT domain-containing protein [Leptospira wolffii]